jgi:hypothetical protein
MDKRGLQVEALAKGGRRSARAVAEVGLERLFAGKLSSIDGRINALKARSLRLVPRAVVARFLKTLMTATSAAGPAVRAH